jgi:hypothetical protein
MDGLTKTTTAPLTFSAEDFGKAIKLCKPALPHIALLPPRLEITEYNDYAALLARDIEIEITVPIGRAKPVAAMALPARAFKNLFSSAASSADIIISTNKSDFIKVEVDGMVAEFPEEDPEYPSPTHAGAHNPAINIDRKTLGHALNITTHAMSTEETRYYLNGVCLAPHPADPTAITCKATVEAQQTHYRAVIAALPTLRGKNLACWCPLPAPGDPDICHAAIYLEMANYDPRNP